VSKAFDTGKSLADLVLAKLPENLRAEAAKAFSAPEAADALTLLGDSALARADYSREMDAIKAKAEELQAEQDRINGVHETQIDWWTKNNAALEEWKKMKAEGGTPPKKDDPPPVSGMTKEDFEALLNQRDAGYASVLGLATTLATQHFKDFGEVMDGSDLIAFAQKQRLSLPDAYKQKFAEKISAKQAAEEKTRIDKLVEDRLAVERKQLQSQPFPLRNQEPSALDVLTQTEKPVIPDPAEFYQQLQASRG